MVRRLALCIAAALAAPAPGAAQVDWRAAGGPLIVGAAGPAPAAPTPPASSVSSASPRLPAPEQPFAAEIARAAERHNLDPKLLHALVAVESAYAPDAVSTAGAAGLTQLMPKTARALGVADRFDPVDNVHGGAAYLAEQVVRFGDVRLALAAFNAGPGRVETLGRIPAIPETQAYVAAVVDCFLALAAGREIRSARDCRRREATP